MTVPRALLVALCLVSLASAGCGRYGPPRRVQPVREQGIEIEKKGRPAPETPAPREEPKEEEEPESR